VGARLGQHFLFDPSILDRIADAAVGGPDETVLEIGPGKGSLTRALAARAARVVAIEADRRLAAALAASCPPHVRIVAGDALRVPWPAADVVCGNIPYQITSPLIERALAPDARRTGHDTSDAPPAGSGLGASATAPDARPARIVFLVQREVADRLAAEPGGRTWGALSAGVRLVASVERLFRVPAGAFRPKPRVDSAVVRLTPRAAPLVASLEEERRVRRLIQAAFQRRRQQLARTLREAFGVERAAAERMLAGAGAAPGARVEVLAPEQLVTLARALGPHLGS
jgi:16S rRNA (adenine1518-N6/adenine1519-N6)-dimethyltransferase